MGRITSLLKLFLQKSGKNVTFLCGNVSRNFCDEMAYKAKMLGAYPKVFEIIKEEERQRILETSRPKEVDKEVVDSVIYDDAVIWVSNNEDFDVIYCVDEKFREAIMKKSFLLLSFPSPQVAEALNVSYEDYFNNFVRALSYPWEKMKAIGERIKKSLVNCRDIQVRSPFGTNFGFKLNGRDVELFYGVANEEALSKGRIQLQLPAGELFVEPKEGSAEGRIIFDIPNLIDGEIISGIKVFLKGGEVVNFHADRGEKSLKRFFLKSESRTMTELGIGLNPAIKVSGLSFLDEKAFRTVHVGFGKIGHAGHKDFVMSKPTIFADRTLIIKDGQLT